MCLIFLICFPFPHCLIWPSFFIATHLRNAALRGYCLTTQTCLVDRVCVSCLVMSDSSVTPMDYSPASFSVHGILQARILEWVAIFSFRGSFQPRDCTWVSRIAGRFFTIWTTREALAQQYFFSFRTFQNLGSLSPDFPTLDVYEQFRVRNILACQTQIWSPVCTCYVLRLLFKKSLYILIIYLVICLCLVSGAAWRRIKFPNHRDQTQVPCIGSLEF